MRTRKGDQSDAGDPVCGLAWLHFLNWSGGDADVSNRFAKGISDASRLTLGYEAKTCACTVLRRPNNPSYQ